MPASDSDFLLGLCVCVCVCVAATSYAPACTVWGLMGVACQPHRERQTASPSLAIEHAVAPPANTMWCAGAGAKHAHVGAPSLTNTCSGRVGADKSHTHSTPLVANVWSCAATHANTAGTCEGAACTFLAPEKGTKARSSGEKKRQAQQPANRPVRALARHM